LARLGREFLRDKAKSGGLGKLLGVVTGGGRRAPQPATAQPSDVQPSTPRPSQPSQNQPLQQVDPKQQLLEGLFKALKKR
ncbi:MAG: hypothetical protein V1262_16560, partial [Alphaproteobacteria bacterium]|nr:hypothetical protein [Alphaproteobacteria bacterium]